MLIEGEECKFIEGTNEFYAVSVTGKVWSFRSGGNKTKVNKKASIPHRKTTDFLENGYETVHLRINGKAQTRLVHRLVASAFIPNPLNWDDVNHINEIKTDNRVENLEWMSHKDNCNYGSRNEKFTGQNHYNYKWLCPLKLLYLRNVKKLSCKKIGTELGVSHSCVYHRLKDLGIK